MQSRGINCYCRLLFVFVFRLNVLDLCCISHVLKHEVHMEKAVEVTQKSLSPVKASSNAYPETVIDIVSNLQPDEFVVGFNQVSMHAVFYIYLILLLFYCRILIPKALSFV